jgi:hypothetical protein
MSVEDFKTKEKMDNKVKNSMIGRSGKDQQGWKVPGCKSTLL